MEALIFRNIGQLSLLMWYRLSSVLLLMALFAGCDEDIAPDLFDHSRKVLIIGIDGVRSDMITETLAPNLYAFAQREDTWFNPMHKTEEITWSGTNWSSICTGVHVEKHSVTDNFFLNERLNQYPHFFKFINDADPNDELNLLSIAHWSPINFMIAKQHADYTSVGNIYDISVRNVAQRILNENRPLDPDVLFLHFDDVDHAGHFHEFSPVDPTYASEMQRIDGYVGEVIATLESRASSTGEDWLIMVVSDHGGIGNDHGDGAQVPEIGHTIFFLNHPDLQGATPPAGSRMVDVAPTALAFLGLWTESVSERMDGMPLAF